MRVRVKKASSLTRSEMERWSAIRSAAAELDSPFFSPHYTAVVGQVNPLSEVAIVEQDGEPKAFLPFERGKLGIARPIGGIICDFQGLIAPSNSPFAIEDVLDAAGIRIWYFDHLIVEQRRLEKYHGSVHDSPYLDLSGGFDAYLESLRSAGGKPFQRQFELMRKLERELGPVRIEWDARDREAFARVFEWKNQQYVAGGQEAFMRSGTVHRRIVERLFEERAADCSGQLSLLYAGDTLVAGHFGMSGSHVLHYWFPSYDRAHSKFSPGLLLLLCMAREAASRGLKRMDLGRGGEEYKSRFRSGARQVAMGAISRSAPLSFVIDTTSAAARTARRSQYLNPVKTLLRPLVRLGRRLRSAQVSKGHLS